nr:replication protein A 70 kDa DNA-binding subunit B [Tanacetum cinerariifolium]
MRKNKESSFTNHFPLSNKPVATFVSGYISDLSPVKDNIKLRVRILRAWLQPLYNNQQVKNIEMIVMDEHPSEQSKNTATKISTASKNSTKDTFVNKHPIRNIAELLDVEQGVQSVIVGIVIAIQEDKGWWYLGCWACRGKVIKSTDYIDFESEMLKKTDGHNDRWCRKCNAWVALIKSQFRLQIRVQDETVTMSLSLFNDEVQDRIWLVTLLINYVKNMQRANQMVPFQRRLPI